MTKDQFLGWLEGYIEGGGKDVDKILEKARKVRDNTIPSYRFPNYPIV